MLFIVTHRFEIEAETTSQAIELSKTATPVVYSATPKATKPEVNVAEKKVVWPIWASALKHAAAPEDKGIGDVVARIIGPENSEAFKAWYKKITGKDCGCNGRQKLWNQLYPL